MLLGLYLVPALTGSEWPTWVLFIVNFVGYGVISVGFVLAMRARREAELSKREKSSLLPAPEEEPEHGAGDQEHRGERDEGDATVVRGGLPTGVDPGPRAGSEKEQRAQS